MSHEMLVTVYTRANGGHIASGKRENWILKKDWCDKSQISDDTSLGPVDDDHGVEADDGHGDGGDDDEDHVVHRGDAAHCHRGG